MEDSQSQTEPEEDISFEGKTSQNIRGDGHSRSTFGKGTSTVTFLTKSFDMCSTSFTEIVSNIKVTEQHF